MFALAVVLLLLWIRGPRRPEAQAEKESQPQLT
jgi:hypothetical protein